MLQSYTMVGAYGRSYSDKATALKDWKEGKDFKIIGNSYCSIRDWAHFKHFAISLYIRLNDGSMVNVKENVE